MKTKTNKEANKPKHQKTLENKTVITVLLCNYLETSFLPDWSVPRAKCFPKRKRQELH